MDTYESTDGLKYVTVAALSRHLKINRSATHRYLHAAIDKGELSCIPHPEKPGQLVYLLSHPVIQGFINRHKQKAKNAPK
jgi:hypothetical protein